MARLYYLLPLLFLLFTLPGCALVEGIFKIGMWFGILIVVLIVGLIFWLVSRVNK